MHSGTQLSERRDKMDGFLLYFFIAAAIPYTVSAYVLFRAYRKFGYPKNEARITGALGTVEILVSLDGAVYMTGTLLYITKLLGNYQSPPPTLAPIEYITAIFIGAWVPQFIVAAYLRFGKSGSEGENEKIMRHPAANG